MTAYIIRRIIYALPILVGVNIITFALFFLINTTDDIARMQLGNKRVTDEAVLQWKKQHNYDMPLFFNVEEQGIKSMTATIFFQHSVKLFVFDFGQSDSGRDISYDISQRIWPSLAITLPTLIIGLTIYISVALMLVFFRAMLIDRIGVVLCVMLMSISGLFYVIGGQFVIAKLLYLVPISGYDTGINAIKFLMLPILVGVIGGFGASVRWYRTLFLEEASKDYVKTARAKGLSEYRIFYRHILANGMIPILTGVVVILPSLFIGSLVIESFFSIPGLGSYTIDAINRQDFAIVRAMVYLGSVLYIIGLILTDISYTIADPRIRLQ